MMYYRKTSIGRISALLIVVIIINNVAANSEDLVYGYECQNSKCVKVELSEKNFESAISLPVCHMFCGNELGTVWPKPTGPVQVDPLMLHIDPARITYDLPKEKASPRNQDDTQPWSEVTERLNAQVKAKLPEEPLVKKGGHALNIKVTLKEQQKVNEKAPKESKLTVDTDESYELKISATEAGTVNAVITADNFFGSRHGLETLMQLIVYDDIRRELQLLGKAEIHDAPVYKWRGLLIDTSRNFYSVKALKRTLDAMGMVKLNTLHWHITDSHSFPLEIKSQPSLSKIGAYSPSKVYTAKDVQEIVQYGKVRGVRVMPEFDAPAHVGEGWQDKNMTACFRAQPWIQYCVEPPCGQLDPTVDAMYDVLQDIYAEMNKLFQPEVFHMGGDEVSVACWNSSERIRDYMKAKGWNLQEQDYMRLWNEFQEKALQRYDAVSVNGKEVPIVLWTSHLTQVPYIDQYLNKSRYIIQIWTTGSDVQVQNVLKRGFRIILSNYDALYFDCGNTAWVTSGNNWCSPYIGWQRVYDNDVENIVGSYNEQLLGSEAAVWSEQIDEQTLDARLWPRASALAERLWSNPKEKWQSAESRILLHREHLVENGIAAEPLQPEWCLQNEGECPI